MIRGVLLQRIVCNLQGFDFTANRESTSRNFNIDRQLLIRPALVSTSTSQNNTISCFESVNAFCYVYSQLIYKISSLGQRRKQKGYDVALTNGTKASTIQSLIFN